MSNLARELDEGMRDLGWRVHRRGKHVIWAHPGSGQLVTTSLTPSDPRGVKNALSLARRLLRSSPPNSTS